jgi:hypothetical protein
MRLFLLILALLTAALPTRAAEGPGVVPPIAEYDTVHGRDGFWRLAQEAKSGHWWFVSPDGKREFLNSVTTVRPTADARERNGPAHLSADYHPSTDDTARDHDWAVATLRRVKDAGFKGIGAWSHPALHQLDVPITRDLNLSTYVPWDHRRLFTPGWFDAIESAARPQVEPLRDNRNLVGYYLDNELDWSDAGAGPSHYFDYLALSDPNRAEVVAVIKALWPGVADYNLAFNTNLKSWDELLSLDVLPHAPQAAYQRLYSAWLTRLATEYFRVTTSAVRRLDPNHLILGIRFRGSAPTEVIAASRDYTDAQSINYYPADAKLDEPLFRSMHDLSGGQPIIVTEYSFHSLDNRSGARNTFGFSAQVPDQAARAEGYKLMTTRLARVPYVVGADWFQWADEPPSGRKRDGEDVAFGIVDIDDRDYEPLVDAVRATTPLLNDLHTNADAGPDVWRDRYATLPSARVPYLAKPPRLNGELSDWPADTILSSVRDVQTVGLDSTGAKAPIIRLGWRAEGLYVALEVFDADVVSLPASADWWTRDNVELLLSTQPLTISQQTLDTHCQAFFFLPVPFPDATGQSGILGQRRLTSAATLASNAPLRHVTRILKDRYVAEIFIPAATLPGFDPIKQPRLAFNVLVRDFQTGHESFWSAPKELLTQQRPATWGHLNLAPPPSSLPDGLPIADTALEAVAR